MWCPLSSAGWDLGKMYWHCHVSINCLRTQQVHIYPNISIHVVKAVISLSSCTSTSQWTNSHNIQVLPTANTQAYQRHNSQRNPIAEQSNRYMKWADIIHKIFVDARTLCFIQISCFAPPLLLAGLTSSLAAGRPLANDAFRDLESPSKRWGVWLAAMTIGFYLPQLLSLKLVIVLLSETTCLLWIIRMHSKFFRLQQIALLLVLVPQSKQTRSLIWIQILDCASQSTLHHIPSLV